MNRPPAPVISGTGVALVVESGEISVVSGRWLRDHGEDPKSIDPSSRQRVVDTFSIPRDIAPVSLVAVDRDLQVTWTDGATTHHDLAALTAVISAPRSPDPARQHPLTIDPGLELWADSPEPTLLNGSAIDDDDGWADALRHLHLRGWVMFDGVDLGRGAVERLAARLGYVRQTVFGGIWTMAAGATEHLDSAYDTTPLDVHTDCSYSHDGPGTIVFAQQERTGEGGDSVLVDGFAAARDFAAAEPAAADLLTRFQIRGHYLEPGVHLVADRVPLRLDPNGELRQVTFNNYDRAPVLPVEGWVDEIIDAYAAFREVICEPGRALRLPWQPGRLLIIDNWRLLHGRTNYTGSRSFLGFYSNHEDLESALRVHGLA